LWHSGIHDWAMFQVRASNKLGKMLELKENESSKEIDL
jgi:hypothetical protein